MTTDTSTGCATLTESGKASSEGTPVPTFPGLDTPRTEPLPKGDLPKVDLPRVDQPKVDLPKIDQPKVDLPKVDLPKVEMYAMGG